MIFRFVWIDRKTVIQKKVPDSLSSLFGVERFVLCVANPAEFLVFHRRLSSVALAHELNYSFAGVYASAQYGPQIAFLGAENILPLGIVTEKRERISH
jgi:hypothetical protein